ncbi:hypothetical protein GCM10023079_07850 [Streptomyces chitinivorans]
MPAAGRKQPGEQQHEDGTACPSEGTRDKVAHVINSCVVGGHAPGPVPAVAGVLRMTEHIPSMLGVPYASIARTDVQ